MQKTIFLICLSAVMMLHGADKLKVNKPDASSQLYEFAGTNNLTFTNSETSKLKIKKPDGTFQLFNLCDIANLSFTGAGEIEKAEFFKKLGIGLVGNYPNPFNLTTTISFTTSNSGVAKVEVFNQTGKLVSTLHDGNLVAGSHAMQRNAKMPP